MAALAKAADHGDEAEAPGASRPADEFGWGAMRLAGLLAAMADRHADRLAFRDQAGRDEWSGRPRIDWTYPFAYEIVQRLALFFAVLGLAPRTPVGVCLPNGSEACLAILAIEQAGLTPCLLPVAWPEEDLGAAVEAAGLQAVVTQGVIAEERPAEAFCRLAARNFGLRFVCSFGPLVPDGVIDLDRIILSTEALDPAKIPSLEAPAGAGVVTFSRRGGRVRPVFRSCQSLVASAVSFLVPAKIRPGERILSLLPPDDHRGLVTGLIASLLGGATLDCIGLFDALALARALEDGTPTHLVAPGWAEEALARCALPPSVTSVILVHEAPARFKARSGIRVPVVDALALGEEALVTRAREPGGQFALSLDDEGPSGAATRNLLRLRRAEDGAIELGGLAAEAAEFGKDGPKGAPGEWRSSGYRADLFAGIVIGVS